MQAINNFTEMMKTADKLSELMEAVKVLSDRQTASLMKKLTERSNKLKQKEVTSQEDATERAISMDQPKELRQKGHKDQFFSNAEIGTKDEEQTTDRRE